MHLRQTLRRMWPVLGILFCACTAQPAPQVIVITATPPPATPTERIVVVTATPLAFSPTARVIVLTATPLPSPTETRLPTVSPAPPTPLPPTAVPATLPPPTFTPVPLPTATPPPLIASGDPGAWLPDPQDIPTGMVFDKTDNESNEVIAGNYPNAAEVMALLNGWGRVSNSYRDYYRKDWCSLKNGIASVSPQTVLLTSEWGALQYLNFLKTRDQGKADGPLLSGAPPAGQRAFWYYANDTDGCKPANALRLVRLQWQRNNTLGDVRVWAAAGTVSDADLMVLATRVARVMDAKVVAASGPGNTVAPAAASTAAAPTALSGPPGIYVTLLTVEPPAPKRGQGVRFVATFANTTGAAKDLDWLVAVYEPGKKNSFGETAATHITVPPGVSKFSSADNWAVTGSGGCISFYAQPFLRNPDASRQAFGNNAGGVASPGFEVCP